MTIAATGSPPATVPLLGKAAKPADPASSDGLPFGKTLLDLLDRQLSERDGDQRPFASGTMPSTVTVFNAHGFFNGSAPLLPVGGPAVMSKETLASGEQDSGDRPSPEEPSPPTLPLLASELPVTAISPIQSDGADPDGGLSSRLAGTLAPMSSPPSSAPEGQASEMPPWIKPALRSASVATRERIAGPMVPARATATPPSDKAGGARMSVGIDMSGDGVAVSVVSDHWSDDDADALHPAVARLLARHGLVLSELRVTRRGTADYLSEGGK